MPDDRLSRMADELAASEDFRVLRRLDVVEGPRAAACGPGSLTACVLDFETTGLDPARHAPIELSIRTLRFDLDGSIAAIGHAHTWREDPGEPLDPVVSTMTGLADADLAGQRFDDGAVIDLARSASVMTAFNAAFDRKFFERRFPSLRGMAWACGLREVDWRARNFEGGGRSLPWLLAQAGFFHGAHRAQADVDALVTVLGHVGLDGRTALGEMMETAARPGWRISAVGANFAVKDKLKSRGYSWNAEEAVWTREVPDHGRYCEEAWLASAVYAPEWRPKIDGPLVSEVTWYTRHG